MGPVAVEFVGTPAMPPPPKAPPPPPPPGPMPWPRIAGGNASRKIATAAGQNLFLLPILVILSKLFMGWRLTSDDDNDATTAKAADDAAAARSADAAQARGALGREGVGRDVHRNAPLTRIGHVGNGFGQGSGNPA